MGNNKNKGYTWWPKDWATSPEIFRLNLAERGFYRELIDLAMTQDNEVLIEYNIWARLFDANGNDIVKYVSKLEALGLIEVESGKIFIPSCEKRLKLVRAGSKGGKKSKPTAKHIVKPSVKPLVKQTETETETETESKEKKKIPTFEEFKNHADSKSDIVSPKLLKLKYDSWVENGWKTGHDKPIKNWKSTLTNTIQYLEDKSLEKPKKLNPIKHWNQNSK